jgi:hypothetical protein
MKFSSISNKDTKVYLFKFIVPVFADILLRNNILFNIPASAYRRCQSAL